MVKVGFRRDERLLRVSAGARLPLAPTWVRTESHTTTALPSAGSAMRADRNDRSGGSSYFRDFGCHTSG
jgi:hypothetical protein